MSIFWEVILSVILSKKCICTCVPIRKVSEIEQFHSTVAKLLIKRYYVLFIISVFIVQVTKLVQFTWYKYIFENSTVNIYVLCNSCEDMACCSSECVLTFLYSGDNIH